MQDRYSGLSAAMARSMALPSSRASSSSSARFLLRTNVERGGLDLSGRGRVRRPVDADRADLSFAQVIDRDVVRDLEQPARQPEFGPIPVDVVQDLDERVLCQVLRRLAIAHHAIDEREDRPLVAPDQFAKCILAPPLRPAGRRRHPGGSGGRGCAGALACRGPSSSREREADGTTEAKDALNLGPAQGLPGFSPRATFPRDDFDRARCRRSACGSIRRSGQASLRSPDLFRDCAALRPPESRPQPQHRPGLATCRPRRTEVAGPPDGTFLDLCAGTLDIGADARALDRFPRLRDSAPTSPSRCCDEESARLTRTTLAPVTADALSLPLRDGSIDGAIVALRRSQPRGSRRGIPRSAARAVAWRALRDPRVLDATVSAGARCLSSVFALRAAGDRASGVGASDGVHVPSGFRREFPYSG